MHLRTLGKLELEPNDFPHPKSLLLLCYLSLGGAQDRRRLARLFWPQATDPLNRLSVTLSRLKKAVPGVVEADQQMVWTELQSDAADFLAAFGQDRHEQAVSLYGGRFLENFYLKGLGEELEEWLYKTRDDLAQRRLEAGLRLAEALAADGRFELAAARAEAAYERVDGALLEQTTWERLYTLLLAGNSLQIAAVQQEAAALGWKLASQPAAARNHLLGLNSPRSVPTNLQRRATSFVGRDLELLELRELLARADRPLVTLSGPGGTGKSRLALQAAADQLAAARFSGGVYFVALEALTSGADIPLGIADALGISLPGAADPLQHVIATVADKRLLLILDNFEHLVDESSSVTTLLRHCPKLKLLVTSREHLGLEEEWRFPLEGLPFPKHPVTSEEARTFAAVTLFSERAERAGPAYYATEDDIPHISEICRLTEGSPLALELAAAWVGVLNVADIAREITNNLDLLTTLSRNGPDRHQSLRGVFEQSWTLLTPGEQASLRKLAVFRDGFERVGAAEVAGATLPVLASLVSKSLIRALPRGRYDRHPLLYGYTQEKLAARPREQARTQAKHAAYFLAVAEDARRDCESPDTVKQLDRLEADHNNLRAALNWAERCHQYELLLRLSIALEKFWTWRGYHKEALSWFQKVVDKADLLSDKRLYAHGLEIYSYICLLQADYLTPHRLLPHSLAIRRQFGDKEGEAQALSCLGMLAVWQGDYAAARTHYETALVIARALGQEERMGRLLNNLGDVFRFQADPRAAHSYYEESLALERAVGNRQMESNVLGSLGLVVLEEGDVDEARRLLLKSLRLVKELGITFSVPTALEQFASLETAAAQPLKAARLWGAAEALREEINAPLDPFEQPFYQAATASARRQAEDASFAKAWAEGRQLSQEAATAWVLTEESGNASVVLEKLRDA